jgi:hypothetical protein
MKGRIRDALADDCRNYVGLGEWLGMIEHCAESDCKKRQV